MASPVTHLLDFDREVLGKKSSCATNDASVNSDTNTKAHTNSRYCKTSTPKFSLKVVLHPVVNPELSILVPLTLNLHSYTQVIKCNTRSRFYKNDMTYFSR